MRTVCTWTSLKDFHGRIIDRRYVLLCRHIWLVAKPHTMHACVARQLDLTEAISIPEVHC